PKLRPANIIGYTLAKWGDYPALIDSEQKQVDSGCAWLVKDEEQAQNFACSETRVYKCFLVRFGLQMARRQK
ncbi:uncharacterized protein EURHEDRAFT_539063, partial [Aspergillus ruber CBS 135680]